MASKQQVRFCGFGGQGIILAGFITGQAATVYEHRNAVLTQDYGPEARGGSCKADVVVSDEPVLYPYVDVPDVLIAMSQEAFQKYIPRVRPDTTVIYDEDLVSPNSGLSQRLVPMPARRIAQQMGRMVVANVAMLGFFTGATGIVSADAMKQSILASVPKSAGKLNLVAFEEGFAAARKPGAGK